MGTEKKYGLRNKKTGKLIGVDSRYRYNGDDADCCNSHTVLDKILLEEKKKSATKKKGKK